MLGLLYCSAAWCRALPVLVHGREKVQIGHFGFWSMMLFLGVPTIDFIYEWKKGALEWD
jgi:NADH:ubiquinone oxidoreductase subunit 3 (subunit A)